MSWGDIILNIETLVKMEKPLAPLYMKIVLNKFHCVIPHVSDFSSVKKYKAKGVNRLFLKAQSIDSLFQSDAKYSFMKLGAKDIFSESQKSVIQSLYQKSAAKFQRAGWIEKVLVDAPSWSFTAFVFLTKNSSLGQSFSDSFVEDPDSIEHSFDVLHLALILKNLLCEEANEIICEDISLFALTHDLGKITIPKDIRRRKITQLDEREKPIFLSHSQNISLIVDRDSEISSEGKNLYKRYDLIERENEIFPFVGAEALWCVILANRLVGASILTPKVVLNDESFFNSLCGIDLKSLDLPNEIEKLLNTQIKLLRKRLGFEPFLKVRAEE